MHHYTNFITASAGGSLPGIFDLYPGAGAGFSTRQLKQDAPYAMQIKRTSDGELKDIGFTDGWINQTEIINHCGISAGEMTIWYDQSGNGNHASVASEPYIAQIYNGTSINTVNGKPALLANANGLAYPFDGSFLLNSPYTIFCTFQRLAGYGSTLLGGTNPTTNGRLNFGWYDAPFGPNALYLSQYFNDLAMTESGAFPMIMTAMQNYNGSTNPRKVWLNGTLKGSNTTNGHLISVSGLAIGRIGVSPYSYFKGSYQEVLAWPQDLTVTQSDIENDINMSFTTY